MKPGNPNTIIKCESKRPKREGYKTIPTSKLARIVIQYKIDGRGTTNDLDKRVQVENLMNECLGWKGLGHCDGGDIGSGTMNVFCFVVDAETAVPHVVEELKTNGALNGAASPSVQKMATESLGRKLSLASFQFCKD